MNLMKATAIMYFFHFIIYFQAAVGATEDIPSIAEFEEHKPPAKRSIGDVNVVSNFNVWGRFLLFVSLIYRNHPDKSTKRNKKIIFILMISRMKKKKKKNDLKSLKILKKVFHLLLMLSISMLLFFISQFQEVKIRKLH